MLLSLRKAGYGTETKVQMHTEYAFYFYFVAGAGNRNAFIFIALKCGYSIGMAANVQKHMEHGVFFLERCRTEQWI